MAKRTSANESQRQYVVKANDLIRKTRYSLTTQQQKIVLYAISKIKPKDTPNTEYEISIDDLCAACGIELDNGGYYYQAIKNDLKRLTDRLWVQMPDKSETTVSWIRDATIIPLCGKVYITFHEKLAPYLFDLHERYTQYHLEEVLVFKSKYAIRLYEILRSYTTQQAIENGWEKNVMLSVEELRNLLAVDAYPRWAEFDRCIIKKAIQEINECSDEIHVEYEPYRDGGRSIAKVNFIITTARAPQMIKAHKIKKYRLKKA